MLAITADAGYGRRCRLLSPMSALVADVGCCRADHRCDGSYYRRCLLLLLSLLSLMPMLLVRCLHSEIDAAGHANVLETPLLLSSDLIAADVELDQRPRALTYLDISSNTALVDIIRTLAIPTTHLCPPQKVQKQSLMFFQIASKYP
jgi:hypothetical protein